MKIEAFNYFTKTNHKIGSIPILHEKKFIKAQSWDRRFLKFNFTEKKLSLSSLSSVNHQIDDHMC